MKTRNVAVCIFTDGEDVIIQDRRGHSRVGERYGFWGGQLENAKPTEGKGTIKMSIEKVIEGKDFPAGSTKFLENFSDEQN